ncbi:MAG: hypothetical protein J6J16_09360 [Lachnospiraceae bacterium]|nr:hypothetical protein [Lachnospiraceae bacterium]
MGFRLYDYLSQLTPEELFVLLVVCVSISVGVGIVVIICESVKKVGHIEKSRPLLPRKIKKKQKVRKKSGI